MRRPACSAPSTSRSPGWCSAGTGDVASARPYWPPVRGLEIGPRIRVPRSGQGRLLPSGLERPAVPGGAVTDDQAVEAPDAPGRDEGEHDDPLEDAPVGKDHPIDEPLQPGDLGPRWCPFTVAALVDLEVEDAAGAVAGDEVGVVGAEVDPAQAWFQFGEAVRVGSSSGYPASPVAWRALIVSPVIRRGSRRFAPPRRRREATATPGRRPRRARGRAVHRCPPPSRNRHRSGPSRW